MTRQELIAELARLAGQAQQHEGTLAAAGVLMALIGALHGQDERALLSVCAEFSRQAIRDLRSREN